MTTTGSSIISALGAGSGIDFGRLATDLSEVTFANQRQTLGDTNARLEARISAVSNLRSMVTSLVSALGDRLRAGDLAPRANLSNPAIASVTALPGTSPRGSYTLEVTQLASGQRLVMPPLAGGATAPGAGSLTIRFGAVGADSFTEDAARPAITLDVTAGETLAQVAGRITSASGGAVSAQVLNGTSGPQLVLTGREGAANGFVIETSGGDLSALAWDPASNAGQLQTSAQDARFRLNSVEMSSASNRVTGLPEGIGLTLTALNPGAPASFSFSNNTSAITAVMGDLVSALNSIIEEVNTLANPLGGELANDPGARQLRRELAQLSGQVVMPNAQPGDPRTLADLGLALNRDGTLRLDEARLGQALSDTPRAVAAMFTTGASGVFATLDRMARNATRLGDPGTLGGSLARFQRQLQSNNARLEKIAEQQENLRLRLTRNFTASERRVGASQATLTFLQQQIDIWSAQRR